MRARSGGWGLKRQYSAQGRRNRAEYGGKGATRNFRDAVAQPQKLSLKDLTATNQIPYPLLPLRRYPNRHQFPRPLQPGQFLGILAIVRAPVSRPSQNQRRSHDYRKGYHDPTPTPSPGNAPLTRRCGHRSLMNSGLAPQGLPCRHRGCPARVPVARRADRTHPRQSQQAARRARPPRHPRCRPRTLAPRPRPPNTQVSTSARPVTQPTPRHIDPQTQHHAAFAPLTFTRLVEGSFSR